MTSLASKNCLRVSVFHLSIAIVSEEPSRLLRVRTGVAPALWTTCKFENLEFSDSSFMNAAIWGNAAFFHEQIVKVAETNFWNWLEMKKKLKRKEKLKWETEKARKETKREERFHQQNFVFWVRKPKGKVKEVYLVFSWAILNATFFTFLGDGFVVGCYEIL